jgi:hypothetical protein
MTRRCAWCQENMGLTAPLEDEGITHGVCLPCSRAILRAAGKEAMLVFTVLAPVSPAEVVPLGTQVSAG